MTTGNAEIVRRGYEAFNRGDTEGMTADLAPGFEYRGTGSVPGVPVEFRGADGWIQAVSWLRDEFDDPTVEVRELLERDDSVLANVVLHGRGKQSGAGASWELWQVWAFLDDKVVRGQAVMTREQAFELAGISE